MYIDTHCHLTFDAFDTDRAMVIGNAKKAGVKQFISPGVDGFSSKRTVELAEQHTGVVYGSVGFHPYEAQNLPDITYIENLIGENVVAIGECGLDYHLYKGEEAEGKKSNQKRLFQDHIRLANKYNLPLIMHCRDAFVDFFDCIDAQERLPRGVIHCFSGGLQDLRFAQERKLFAGIDGNVTYSKYLKTIVAHMPISMILLETDAPYLTPVPYRGKRNEPKYIPVIAETVAEILAVDTSYIESHTTANAQTLFQFA